MHVAGRKEQEIRGEEERRRMRAGAAERKEKRIESEIVR